MAICQKCHKTIPDNASFCEHCGAIQPLTSLGKNGPGSQPNQYPNQQTYPGSQAPSPPYQQGTSPGQQQPYSYPPQLGIKSPKKRDVVILLCFFVGFFGAHRFYLGKIGTGMLMIITFGGMGIWVIVDFFISVFGKYTDADGRWVDPSYEKGVVLFLFIWAGAIFLLSVIYMIALMVAIGNHSVRF